MIGPRKLILPAGGRRLRAARPVLLAVLAATIAAAGPAAAQGMLRGSLDPLPGADDDFSPYALGPAPDTAFGAPVAEEAPPGPYSASPPPLPETEPRPRRSFQFEDDPYEQLGIRAGAFLVKPSLTLRGGYDSNPQADNPAQGSSYGRADARIDVESDWIRHAFRGRLDAGYEAYKEFPDENAPDFAADAALRLDVREDIRVDAAFRGSLDTDTRDDPELVGVSSTEENLRLGASLGMVYKPGRVSLAPTIEAQRTDFGDPSLDDRDYSQYEVRLRTGFELSPALEPFAEVSRNERIYDLPVNGAGVEHDSKGYRVYGGVRFAPDPIWTAEAKIGYGEQKAEDPLVPVQTGLVGEATLIWEPSVLTQLRLSGGRDFEATTVECCAVADAWFARASFAHEFREWLILTGEVGYRNAFHENIGYRLANIHAELELEYKFNRMLSALGRVEYRELNSSADTEDYDATIVSVGLRLQR